MVNHNFGCFHYRKHNIPSLWSTSINRIIIHIL